MKLPGLDLEAGTIFCIGRNYVEHTKELNNPIPSSPLVFLKPRTSLALAPDGILLPAISQNVHHETEIVLAIGHASKGIDENRALDLVAGVAVGIDVTARDLQDQAKQKGNPWTLSKGLPTFACISSFVKASLPLSLELKINGEVRQKGSSDEMIFSIPRLVSYLANTCGDETFRENFGQERTLPQTMRFFGSARLPRMATEQMEFQHQIARPALRRRLLKEMGPPPRSQSQQSFLDKLWAVRKSNYHRLDLSSVTAMFCFLGDNVDDGDDNYYLSFPEGEVIDTILKDAEARLEMARTSVSPRVRKEQFFIALYGYVVARPYRAGNQAIGWPIFAGIYEALTGELLPGIYGRDDLSRIATLSQAWFVEKVGQEMESHRRK